MYDSIVKNNEALVQNNLELNTKSDEDFPGPIVVTNSRQYASCEEENWRQYAKPSLSKNSDQQNYTHTKDHEDEVTIVDGGFGNSRQSHRSSMVLRAASINDGGSVTSTQNARLADLEPNVKRQLNNFDDVINSYQNRDDPVISF